MTTLVLLALMQTTTTVTTDQQPPPPPPPVAASPSTQVVVQPGDTAPAPPPASPTVTEMTSPSGRSTAAIIATDALYGGFAGGLVGGGITLIDQGNHWQRDLMVGAGVGILAGAAFGAYEAAVQPQTVTTVRRAEADPNPAESNTGTQLAALSGRF
ncbi:MAG TPA: hypothetical protein VLW85_07685 [Myxococcales bacterium]|nr:hypothetical protein [Myxococcales bacterium]